MISKQIIPLFSQFLIYENYELYLGSDFVKKKYSSAKLLFIFVNKLDLGIEFLQKMKQCYRFGHLLDYITSQIPMKKLKLDLLCLIFCVMI